VDGEDVDFEKLIRLQELDVSLKQVTAELSDIPGLIAGIEKKSRQALIMFWLPRTD